jgi:putative ABC transport system substrate-binding protein
MHFHRVNRRECITLLGSAAVSPFAVHAQEASKASRIGFLRYGSASAHVGRVEALRAGLHDLGYVEGRNIFIEFRWTDSVDQLPEFASELARMNVDVILAMSSTEVEYARQVTKTIPIVFAAHADPVGVGHVASLARPGGNITGLTIILTDIVAKQLELLKEAVPQAARIGVLFSPTAPSHRPAVQAVQTAGQMLGVQLQLIPVRTSEEVDEAFAMMAREHTASYLVVAAPVFILHRVRIAELALRYRLPGMFGTNEGVEAGGLMRYSADLNDMCRRTAIYIDKILRGVKPADLPVEQASKYQLVINLKTARALGLDVPPTLLARADEVIE